MLPKSLTGNMMNINTDMIPQVAESSSDGRRDQNESIHTSQDIGFDRQAHYLNHRMVTEGPNLSIPSSCQLWVFRIVTVSPWPFTRDNVPILHRKAWPQRSKNRSRRFRCHRPDRVALAIEIIDTNREAHQGDNPQPVGLNKLPGYV